MTGSVLSTGDGHQGWQDKLSIMMVLELSICLKLKTVLDKGYSSQNAERRTQNAADCWRLRADGRMQHHSPTAPRKKRRVPNGTHGGVTGRG